MNEPEIPTEIIIVLMAILFAALVVVTYSAYEEHPNRVTHYWMYK